MDGVIDEALRQLDPPVEVSNETLNACRSKDQFVALLFELYKEAASLACVSSAVCPASPEGGTRLNRNQAICVGLLLRVSKLMVSVVKLSAGIEHGETVQVLNRCIIESAVNLRYLLHKDENESYDQFVKTSLRAEGELYDIILTNIEDRGGKRLIIEESMLRSILKTCEQSGLSIEEVSRKADRWGGNFEQKLKSLGIDRSGYVVLQMIPSHATHGDWVDLTSNHLLLRGHGFEPNFDWTQTDGELLSPVAIFIIDATREYLNKYFDSYSDMRPLQQRLASLQERLTMAESSRQDWQLAN